MTKNNDYTPYYFSAFKPFGYQKKALNLLYNYDYKNNFFPEILLSGSVGSAKSALLAHWVISHCLRWPRARVGISRMGMPDLKKTLYQEIMDSLENDPNFIEGVHYKARHNNAYVMFANKSEIIPMTFGDRNWGKSKSYLFSGVVLEEGTEFDDDFYNIENSGFDLLKGRINRLAHVKENFLIVASNPGEPDHFLYDYFIQGSKNYDNRYVFYSLTEDNKYLDPNYIAKLKRDYSRLMAERYLRGQWISLAGKGVYAAYNPEFNFINSSYNINNRLPVRISFDFNISENKPMSAVLFQYNPDSDCFHFFNESVIDGSYTQDIMTDLDARGLLDFDHIIIHGDATGKARHTSSKIGNYDVIRQYLESKGCTFEIQVPKANPPIRKRHQIVNAYCHNDLGDRRLFVYNNAPTANLGMRLTNLKPGANYIEDDSKPYQHITTAMGYGIFRCVTALTRKSRTQKL